MGPQLDTIFIYETHSNVFVSLLNWFSRFIGVFQNSADDLENADDVYEAIGGLLQDITTDRSEEDIK